MYEIIKVWPMVMYINIYSGVMVKENIQYLGLQPANIDVKILLSILSCNYIKFKVTTNKLTTFNVVENCALIIKCLCHNWK